jgi:hypothetical protein
MNNSSRIFESLIIPLVIFLFFQFHSLKGADILGYNLKINFNPIQINRPELPIGPVGGNCLKCRFIPANPIIFLELLQNAGSAITDHWFRTELFDYQKSGVVNNISYNALINPANQIFRVGKTN